MPHTLFLDDNQRELVLTALRYYAASEHTAFKRKAAATLLADLTGDDADANLATMLEMSADAKSLYLEWFADWLDRLSSAMLPYVREAGQFPVFMMMAQAAARALEVFCQDHDISLPKMTFGLHVHDSYVFDFEPANWLQRAAIERTNDPTETTAVPN